MNINLSYVFIHFLFLFSLLHCLICVFLLGCLSIWISGFPSDLLCSSHDTLHYFFIFSDLINGFGEPLHQDEVRVVGVQLKDSLQVWVRLSRLSNSSHLQVLEEVFGFNDLDLACGSILVLSGGVLGFDELLIDHAVEELVKGEVELHHSQHQLRYDFDRFLVHALKVYQRLVHGVAALPLIRLRCSRPQLRGLLDTEVLHYNNQLLQKDRVVQIWLGKNAHQAGDIQLR